MISLVLGFSAKAATREVPVLYEKDIHLLILKHLPDGQGQVGTFFRDGGAGEHHFCTLPIPC